MPISKLIFLSNELQSPKIRYSMGLPLQFITFAHVYSKMYTQSGNNGIFITNQGRSWGNKVVYGSIYLIEDDTFYMRILDAYHGCSLASLRKNHDLDTQHRVKTLATPISYRNLYELETLLYRERDSIEVETYVGNTKHPKIKPRMLDNGRNRITDGIHIEPYLQQYQEVLHEQARTNDSTI